LKIKKKKSEISYFAEIKTQTYTSCSLNIPIWYIFLDKTTTLYLILSITFSTGLLDISRKKIPFVSNLWDYFFGDIMRKHEKKKKKFRLNGASWLTISASLTILIFPKIIAVVALTILIISDISSALIGKKLGRTPFFKKSLEGSTAFFVSASLVVLTYYFIYSPGIAFLYIGIVASLVSAFFEAISKNVKIDDNLLAPISFSIVMWLGELIAVSYGQSFINIL